jgi:hypothetical protein
MTNTPETRIREYLRQRESQTRDLGYVIHATNTDVNAEMAELDFRDLQALVAKVARLERGPKALDYPQRVDVTKGSYVEGTIKVRDLINGVVNSGAVAAVYVQPIEQEG